MIRANTLMITPEVLGLIATLDEFKGAWCATDLLAPERLSSLRRIATIESVGSSTRIEGSHLSDREVEQFLSGVAIRSLATRDEQEVAGYADTIEMIFASWEAIPLTENHIQQLHRDLLHYSEKDEHHRGAYKKHPNNVAAFDSSGRQIGVLFATATPFDTPRLMTELVEWASRELDSAGLHPLLVIAIFIVVFLEIHPFQDGNGRLSRILTTLLLLRAGYSYMPYSSLENVIEHNKEKYYLALRQTQSTVRTERPDWSTWVLFFLRALEQQRRTLAEKLERERTLLSPMPQLSLRILEHVRGHGRLTIREAVALTGSNRNTLKLHLRQLVETRQLVLHGNGRGAWYALL